MKKRVIIAVCIFTLLTLTSAHAGHLKWTNDGGPYGYYVDRITLINPENPNILYTAVSNLGVFKSEDAGETWKNSILMYDFSIQYITFDPNNSETVIVATTNGVYITTNGGKNWHTSDIGLTNKIVWFVAINPVNSNEIYACTWGGLFKSNNRGHTWEKVPFFGDRWISAIAIYPNNPNIMYVSTGWVDGDVGIYKSTDKGEKWTFLGSPSPEKNWTMELGRHVIVGMLVRPDNPDIVYITTWGDGGYMSNNGGATWIRMKIPSIYQGYISIYKLDPNIMCIGTTQGAYKSTDSGNNWKHYLPEADIISIAIHPSNPDIMYVNFSRLGIFKTTDGGNSWKSTYSNITNRRIYAIAIHPDKPDTLIAGVDCPDFFTDIPAFGTYKSINGGLSWNESGPDSIVNKGNPTTVAFAVDWLDHDMIYSVVPGRGVFVSQDFGDNWWKVQNSGLDIRQFNTLVMDPNDNLTLYMGAEYVSELDNDKGIFKTTDGGANWRRFNQGLTDKRIKCLAMSSDSMLYAGTASGVFRIAKDSNQWERAGLDGQEVKALITSPREPSIVYAGTWGGGVYKSTDYGKIWVRKNSGLKNWNIYGLDIAKKNPDILYVGTEGGVFLSVDGSESWQDISEGLPPINTRIGPIVIDQQRPHIVYAATDYGVYCYEGNQLPAAVKSKGKLADNWSSIKNVDMPNVSESKPMKSMLYPNYPNPFNPETWIPYQIDKGTDCSIHIYDASGRIVRVLNIGYKPAGFYTSQDKAIYWDGKNELGEVVASGIYFYTIKAGEFVDTKKMIIVR